MLNIAWNTTMQLNDVMHLTKDKVVLKKSTLLSACRLPSRIGCHFTHADNFG